MGNYRFKLSELMPNSWFYKLRDMGKSRKHHTKNNATSPPHSKQQHVVQTKTAPTPILSHSPLPRKSPCYSALGFSPNKTVMASTSFHPPRRSGKRRLRHRRRPSSGDCKSSPKWVSSTVSSGCSCRAKAWAAGKSPSPPLDFFTTSCDSSLAESFSPDLRSDHVLVPDESPDNNSVSWPSPCTCSSKFSKSPELQLRPIITKPATAKNPANGPSEVTKRKTTSPDAQRRSLLLNTRKSSTTSPGLRLRLSSPRLSARRSVNGGRRSVSSRRGVTEGTAVVKSSANPQKDFKESMVEMIVKNNIRASTDLEELLACYLSLNSDEYHDIIIKVFKQIWVDLNVSAQSKRG